MKQAIIPQKLAFSMSDAMQSLGISRPTLYKLIRNHDLRTYRIGRRRFCTKDAIKELQHSFEKDSAA